MLSKKTILSLIILATIFAYSSCIYNSFVYDDYYFIKENPNIRSLKNIPYFFLNPTEKSTAVEWTGIYRPLRTIFFTLEYKLYLQNPAGYHFTNLLLHLFNILLLFNFLSLLPNIKTGVILITTALFALHPVQSEAVNWIGARADLMLAFFALSALSFYIAYINSLKIRYFLFCSLLFILALLSKETAIVVPVLLLFLIGIFKKKIKLKFKIIPFFIAIAYFALRQFAMKSLLQKPWWGGTFYTNILTSISIFLRYIKLLLFPYNLSIDYEVILPKSLSDINVIISGVFIIYLLFIIFKYLKTSKNISFGILWFSFLLLPALNIIPLTVLVADRFLYLSCIGAFFSISSFIIGLKKTKIINYICVFSFLTLLISYINMNQKRTKDWNNPLTIFGEVLDKNPSSWRAHNNIGSFYSEKGYPQLAEIHFKSAIRLKPNDPLPYRGLGIVQFQQGKIKEAQDAFLKSLRIYVKNSQTGNLLGITYVIQGNFQKAEQIFSAYLKIDPQNIDIYLNLAKLLMQENRLDEAEKILLEAKENNIKDTRINELYKKINAIYLGKETKYSP